MADEVAVARGQADPENENAVLRRYGFAVPTDAALGAIEHRSPAGVVEVGAGVGYWARQLSERGVNVIAYDIAPPPSARNRWFAGSTPWHRILSGDQRVVADHPDRSLLLIWPTKNETWAADALIDYYNAGGACVFYVGDGPGGRTGDPTFHAILGDAGPCLACDLGVVDCPCTCNARQLWRQTAEVTLPPWQAADVRLRVYGRFEPRPASRLGRIAQLRRRRADEHKNMARRAGISLWLGSVTQESAHPGAALPTHELRGSDSELRTRWRRGQPGPSSPLRHPIAIRVRQRVAAQLQVRGPWLR